MKRTLAMSMVAFVLAGCVSQTGDVTKVIATEPNSAQQALDVYYDTIPESALPKAPAGMSLPAETAVLTKILIGSCLDEEKAEAPAMMSIAKEDADLFLMIGDNVYGDRDGRSYANNQADLDELRESFSDLAARDDFQAIRASVPMMVAWDDHDYGANDAGKEFPFRGLAERVHETFWGLQDQDVGQWPGTYYARSFGPEGQRVQVIMLDTRFFRSGLTATDEYGVKGKERYIPAPAGSMQDMLGAAQWTWLQNQLQQPANIRLIASSIQVMPTAHGFEAWSTMPDERQRLFELIEQTDASGVVFLSGDRHTGFIYEESGVLPYQAHELTASSLNLSFRDTSDEVDVRQLGSGVAVENYGAVEIDWAGKSLSLQLKDNAGRTVRSNRLSFSDIGID